MTGPKCRHNMCHSPSVFGPPNLCVDCDLDDGRTYDGDSCVGCFERISEDAESATPETGQADEMR